jgi:hypothetical protein
MVIPPMRDLTLTLGGGRSTLQVSISWNDANRSIDGSNQEVVLKCVYFRVGELDGEEEPSALATLPDRLWSNMRPRSEQPSGSGLAVGATIWTPPPIDVKVLVGRTLES